MIRLVFFMVTYLAPFIAEAGDKIPISTQDFYFWGKMAGTIVSAIVIFLATLEFAKKRGWWKTRSEEIAEERSARMDKFLSQLQNTGILDILKALDSDTLVSAKVDFKELLVTSKHLRNLNSHGVGEEPKTWCQLSGGGDQLDLVIKRVEECIADVKELRANDSRQLNMISMILQQIVENQAKMSDGMRLMSAVITK